MTTTTTQPTEKQHKEWDCCPPFNPVPWQDQTFEWDNKKFIRDKVFTLFYMPMNFGSVMKKLYKKITAAGAETPDFLCLSDHTSKWNMNLYLAVDKDVADTENETLKGTFYSRVYEGDYKHTKEWCDDFEAKAKEKGLNIRKQFMWYTTCPKCAKKFGKNYVAVIGQVE